MSPHTHRPHAFVRSEPSSLLRLGLLPTLFVFAALLMLLIPAGPLAASTVTPARETSPQFPHAFAVPSASAIEGGAAPAASTFNPPCYPVNAGPNNTACVSIQYPTDPDIIPTGSTRVASVYPNATQSIHLVVKAHNRIDYWPNPASSGDKAPVYLNLTGTLWNGNPWYSPYSDTLWHSASGNWWSYIGYESSDVILPYWYSLVINSTQGRIPLFYPGMVVNWDVVIVQNLSNKFYTYEGPRLQYTYAGAWPFSVSPASPLYGGSNASVADLQQQFAPSAPNWNDSVNIALNITNSDLLTRAQIGKAYADLIETDTTGTVIANTTFYFPAGTQGVNATVLTIPAYFAQVSGATVTVTVTAFDTSVLKDQIVLPPVTYIVGGNGSFASGIFDDDLELTTDPGFVLTDPPGTALVAPGQPVSIFLTSRNPGTSISAAELHYTFYSTLNHATQTLTVPFTRLLSTEFVAYAPGFPLGTAVNFTVLAWDFGQHLEVSDNVQYSAETLDEIDPVIPSNLTFFYVMVYDNRSGSWVSGATVSVTGPSGYYNSYGTTTFGVGYPNSTQGAFFPLLLPVNVTYKVSVSAKGFAPGSDKAGAPISVNVTGTNPMPTRGTLLRGTNFIVAEAANVFYFWLNASAPSISIAASVPLDSLAIAGGIGLLVTLAATVPIFYWWREIKARREAEERRITL